MSGGTVYTGVSKTSALNGLRVQISPCPLERHTMNRIQRFLLKAKEVSKLSDHQFKIGCVVANGSVVLSTGHNKTTYKSRGRKFASYDAALHAERNALSKLNSKEVSGLTLYVWRNFKSGEPANSKPCDDCMQMIYELGIVKRVIYTVSYFPYYEEIRI